MTEEAMPENISLLERVAHRIHTLSPAQLSWPPPAYVAQSCRGKPLVWFMGDIERGFPSQFQLFLQHNDTFHLSDVQSVGDNMANEILAKLFGTSVPRARLVFSSTIIPEQWSKGTPKEALFGVSTKRGGTPCDGMAGRTAGNWPRESTSTVSWLGSRWRLASCCCCDSRFHTSNT
jgi:hypothetical protein